MRFDIFILHKNDVVKLKTNQLPVETKIIKPFVGQINKQKLDIGSKYKYNIEDIDDNNLNYYHLFQQTKLLCEARACNTTATKEMKIPIGIFGERVFFFCENCLNKFKEAK